MKDSILPYRSTCSQIHFQEETTLLILESLLPFLLLSVTRAQGKTELVLSAGEGTTPPRLDEGALLITAAWGLVTTGRSGYGHLVLVALVRRTLGSGGEAVGWGLAGARLLGLEGRRRTRTVSIIVAFVILVIHSVKRSRLSLVLTGGPENKRFLFAGDMMPKVRGTFSAAASPGGRGGGHT
ncbi:hypothetical protein PG984_007826 [Apiospora sp. TS-2023a]